ncbi:MAG: nucleotidyl transferase AbiEii/AbiGii toxin family protein [Acidobacteriota bacterium]|nr:nucleotidyl transferase AbiEii/AbiGii toxin family protein [Acidobacteriota bacterium]
MVEVLQAIERFHLLLLSQLGARVPKELCVLKGGCNLRFFLGSIRYSEDIDFDVRTIARATLRKNVDTILESPGFTKILRAQRLSIIEWSAPKQTDTVQRWKVRIQLGETGQEAPTKIEFSRRRIDAGAVLEPVNGQIVGDYGLMPILVNHYRKETAFLQKVSALAHRSATQARDVFDLKFLIDAGVRRPDDGKKLHREVSLACDRALSIGFDEFKAQVVAYLPPEWQEYYGTADAWDALQEQVVDALEREAQ